jgi:hypothetical protein
MLLVPITARKISASVGVFIDAAGAADAGNGVRPVACNICLNF